MALRIQTDYHKYPDSIKQYLIDRVRDRRFVSAMAQEMAKWLQMRPSAPDLVEAPKGWHKKFSSFTICGEGEFVKTMFTIYSPGTPRRGSVDLDQWRPSSKTSTSVL